MRDVQTSLVTLLIVFIFLTGLSFYILYMLITDLIKILN